VWCFFFQAEDGIRAFHVTGVQTCALPIYFMSAIAAWVEDGKAPEQLVASKREGGEVTMTRPICPHPQVAQYAGSGDPNDARNFRSEERRVGNEGADPVMPHAYSTEAKKAG